MRVSQDAILKTIDGRFMKFLNEAYTNYEKKDKQKIAKEVAQVLSTNRYHNHIPELLIDINKGYGVSRPVPVFHPKDYFVYYYCIKKLENKLAVNKIRGTFGGWSLSGINRNLESIESIENDDSLHSGLNPAAGAVIYGEFNSYIKRILNNTADNIKILEIDIANFYDSIKIDHLQRQIRAVSSKAQLPTVDLLFYFIANCNKLLHSYRPQTTGIPQDMIGDCSRILANFYLQEYDLKIKKYCKKFGINYLRFADDQLFIIPPSIEPLQICREASKLLYGLGLNINQKKVKVWNKQDFNYYRSIDLFSILDGSKKNEDQSPTTCNKFTEKSLNVIKKSQRSNTTKYKIKNEGLPLIKKIIGLDIKKLITNNRKKVISEILKTNGYLKYLPEYNLTKLYRTMNRFEQGRLIRAINAISKFEIHASFDYEVMKFKRNNKLKWKNHARKVQRITREWRFT